MNPIVALKLGFLIAAAPLGLLVRRSLHRGLVEALVDPFLGVMRERRKALAANIETAFGRELSDAGIRRMTRAVFANYALYLADYMTFPLRDRQSILGLLHGVRNGEHMDAARAEGRGVLLVGPHVGNWEIAGYLLRDLNCPVHALSIHDPHPSLDRFRAWFRDREGISIVFVGSEENAGGMFEIQSALAKNEAVAMLGDRLYMGRDYVAKFFGRSVRFPAGPLHIAAITGAPVVPFVAVREGDRYTVVLAPPIHVGDMDPGNLVVAGQRLSMVFESFIRRYPEQWYNFEPVF